MRVRIVVPIAVAATAFGGAHLAREQAHAMVGAEDEEAPYAPSRLGASLISAGYREVAADLLIVRFRSYFGGGKAKPEILGDLSEAIITLDPKFRKIYEWGAIALTLGQSASGDNRNFLRAIAMLEAGAREFPDAYKFPNLAGQIYLVDLKTPDPKLRKEWDARAALLLESAARKPGAPAGGALTAAYVQSKLGQQERAIANLRELLLVTDDERARAQILERLAALSSENQDEIASEILVARKHFDAAWHTERPAVPVSMYVLIGTPLAKTFDMVDLALGGVTKVDEPFERLDPLY